MTLIEKRLVEHIAEQRKEIRELRAGAREINKAVDAILVAAALAYGARRPDGSMVLTMPAPDIKELEKYEPVRSEKRESGVYQVIVTPKKSG